MVVSFHSEEEVSGVWILLFNPVGTSWNTSVVEGGFLVSGTESVSYDSSIPFLPSVGWCSPSDDSIDPDSGVGSSGSGGSVSSVSPWAW